MEPSDTKLLSIIVITYFSQDEIVNCLNAVTIPDNDQIETIVIDNASKDDTIALLKKTYGNNPSVQLVFNDENVGFANGVNQGVSIASGKYVLILNPDTVAPIASVLEMVSYMEQHNDVGILGPRITDEKGTVQESYGEDLTPWSELVGKIFHSKYAEHIPFVRKWKNAIGSDTSVLVGWIGGACALLPRSVFLEIGGIDTQFFLSHGDMVDVGKKIKLVGLKAVFYPKVSIIHTGSKSIAFNRDESLRASYSGTLYVFKKYYGPGTVFLAKIIYVCISAIKSCIAAIISLFKKEPFRSIAKAHYHNAVRIITNRLGVFK